MGALFLHAFVFSIILFALTPKEGGPVFFFKFYLLAVVLLFIQVGLDWVAPTIPASFRLAFFAPVCWLILFYSTRLSLQRAALATALFLVYEALFFFGMQALVHLISPETARSPCQRTPMAPEAPLISIVTPSYNQGRFLRQTIESILGQSYRRLELWVIDGGSTDDTVAVLRQFESDPRFHWISEKDRGQSDAINKGLARCQGDIFNWINSDDYLEPGSLAVIAEKFQSSGAEVICGVCRKFEDLTDETTGFMKTELKGAVEETILVGRICQQGTWFRAPVFRSLGGVREDLHCAMDWHLWVKYLVRHGLEKVVRCDSLLAHFRQHPESKTGKAASQFKQEINAVYLDLFSSLGAPDYLRDYLRSLTGLNLPPTDWQPGPSVQAKRLFSLYCQKIVRLYYYDQAYDRAAVWLQRAFSCRPRPSFNLLRFYWKIFYKKNILKQGYKF